jgi:rfaE bifunctional protein kinase chain/domain
VRPDRATFDLSAQPLAPELESPGSLRAWIGPLLQNLRNLSVTVFGDFCLDAYWVLDRADEERSVETGLPLRRVREQRYYLGGAGSVVANLSALGVGTIRVVGVAGDDLFGPELTRLLRQERAVLDGWFVDPALHTLVYAKPCYGIEEESRIDFGAFNIYTESLQQRVLEALTSAVAVSDAIILNQQIPKGLTTPAVIEQINAIIACNPGKLFLADSRHFAARYVGAAIKVNTHEAAEILGESGSGPATAEDAIRMARRIQQKLRKPCFITRGEHGMIAVDEDGAILPVAGIRIDEDTDSVGAGDAVMASIAAAMAGGESAVRAAQLANIAASITVRQLQRTGTASAQQILEALNDLQYLPQVDAQPDLSLAGSSSGSTTAES